jgi:hypothetical protein
MSTGSLLFPIGHVFLDDNGAPVNAGLVGFFRTGTSTEQDTYSDSTLDTANANPVVLNSAGRSTTAIYGDPSSGFDYRIRLATAADVQIWQYDDIVVDGADTATLAEGSFTGTLTGMDAATTGTVSYRITANSAGTGKKCKLYSNAGISGTSNTTALTMTGLPAACTPAVAVQVPTVVADNSTNVIGMASITAAATTIVFACDQPFSTTGFTNSGSKGLSPGWQIEFAL